MSENDQRKLGLQALSQYLTKPQNVNILEKNIHQAVTSDYDYTTILYQVIGDIISGRKLNDILNSLKSGTVGWEHESFAQFKKELDEQDQFSENPIEIVEGVEKCNKCKSTRVFSYSIQTRSADEGMTTFCSCMACGAKWTHSG